MNVVIRDRLVYYITKDIFETVSEKRLSKSVKIIQQSAKASNNDQEVYSKKHVTIYKNVYQCVPFFHTISQVIIFYEISVFLIDLPSNRQFSMISIYVKKRFPSDKV